MRLTGLAVILTLGMLLAPLHAEAQETRAGKVYRVGHLSSLDRPTVNHAAFRAKLRELGWIEGVSIVFEDRFAGRDRERMRVLAAELVRLQPDVIFATGGVESAQALKIATRTIPIVFATAGDPVATGLIASWSRPEANITGLSSVNTDLDAKRLALLKEVLPRLTRVGVLRSPIDPSGAAQMSAAESAARSLGVQLQVLDVRGPQELGGAINTAKKLGAGALIVLGSPTLFEYQRRLGELATTANLPAISPWRQLPEAGGLMSYGADIPEMFRRAAIYVDKILKGAKPGDLPVEQPTKFELVINLKTAKGLGITIPQSVLLGVDQLIQ
jgi:putative tryptophan/tyrosine transport system substrate-binding protein